MKPLTLLFLVLLICVFPANSQDASVKTIPGVFTANFWDLDWKVLQVSPDGRVVLFQQYDKCYFLYPKEGRFDIIKPFWPFADQLSRISPDHSLTFNNSPGVADGRSLYASSLNFTPATPAKNYVAVLSHLTDTKPLQIFNDANFILGINKLNQLIVSNAWTRNGKLAGLKGLSLLDAKTYKVLKVLRMDTLYKNMAPDPSGQPVMFFNTTYSALLTRESTYTYTHYLYRIYPFGSDSIISADKQEYEVWHYPLADQDYLYDMNHDTLAVHSMHTGKLLYKKAYPPGITQPAFNYRRCLIALSGSNHLYRYDREQSTVYEEEVTPEGLRTIKTYPLHLDAALPFPTGNQRYQMVVCAGPSLVIVPRNRIDENVPENAGFVIDLPSGKITLRIAPYFNINAAQLEREANFQASERAAEAKAVADKKAAKDAEALAALNERYADCERILAEAKMKIGTHYPLGALVYKRSVPGYSCRNGYAIWGFNCDTKHFTAAGLGDYDADADKSDYALCETGPYGICPACNGHPLSTSSEYIKDDSWKQTNFNVYKRDVNAVKQVNVTTICDHCKGKGVVKIK